MNNLVIVSFPAKAESLEDLKDLLKAALPDTRNFSGCLKVYTFKSLTRTRNSINGITKGTRTRSRACFR